MHGRLCFIALHEDADLQEICNLLIDPFDIMVVWPP